MTDCPVGYDHTDDLDVCAVCGWGSSYDEPQASGPRSVSSLSESEKILEAVKRLSGGYAPTQHVVVCSGRDLTL